MSDIPPGEFIRREGEFALDLQAQHSLQILARIGRDIQPAQRYAAGLDGAHRAQARLPIFLFDETLERGRDFFFAAGRQFPIRLPLDRDHDALVALHGFERGLPKFQEEAAVERAEPHKSSRQDKVCSSSLLICTTAMMRWRAPLEATLPSLRIRNVS